MEWVSRQDCEYKLSSQSISAIKNMHSEPSGRHFKTNEYLFTKDAMECIVKFRQDGRHGWIIKKPFPTKHAKITPGNRTDSTKTTAEALEVDSMCRKNRAEAQN
ncbi:hypothetical protein AYI70_g54 [Smittium culicis]|uniref:Uncharacterized protein n=1 Tax=Smittium culicis TaxID=133412 RepID=A0A1R1YI71_9FUNG|nr:hypothetical protein AYI70_g54 [Smittium culicis]